MTARYASAEVFQPVGAGHSDLALEAVAEVAPARDPAIVEALDVYVARRKAEGGAPPVT
jgi:hypothetical protein